jgi:hypothetical protein
LNDESEVALMPENAKWLNVLAELESHINEMAAAPDAFVYRGQRDEKWNLLPSLLRQTKESIRARKNESNIFQSFKTRARKFLENTKNDWEILTYMQHYGLPTRLLDWTDSFAVALYFALCERKKEDTNDSAVWIMDAFKMSSLEMGSESIITLLEKADLPGYAEHFVDNFDDEAPPWPYQRPIVVEIPWVHPRIVSQRGLFTLHGKSDEPVEQQCPSQYLRKIVIPNEAIPAARRYLRLAGIDHFTIFPDLEGLATWLKQEYCQTELADWQNMLRTNSAPQQAD